MTFQFRLLSLLYICLIHTWVSADQLDVPDLTKTLDFERVGTYHLGPTGAKGWIYTAGNFMTTKARQILITEVELGTPAEGKLQVGDVILGVGDTKFSSDARKALGLAIDEAEKEENQGRLDLLCWRPDADAKTRKGKQLKVIVQLPVMGAYSNTAPYDCPKTKKIQDAALEAVLKEKDFGRFGVSALALLATGEKEHLKIVRDFLHQAKWAQPDIEIRLDRGGKQAWNSGFYNLVLTEYYLASGDEFVLPAIREHAIKTAMGQSNAGTWGHGFAWTGINGGKLHGVLQGYGAVNQAGLPCYLTLLLAKKCGVNHPEIDAAIERSSQFFEAFIDHGSIGYGFHRPSLEINANGRNGMSGNGKNGVAAVAFQVQGHPAGTRFFSRLTASLYNTMEYGHSGNSYSYFWDPLGANVGGPEMAAAFHKELRWYYALTRKADGSFVNQQLGGQYGGQLLSPTAAQVLMASFPKRAIYLTGKGQKESEWLKTEEVHETINSGRWRMVDSANLSSCELISNLDDWSPIAREWVAIHLAKKEGDIVPELLEMLKDERPEARAGACAALGHLRERAQESIPELANALSDEATIVNIAAGYALARMGPLAKPAIPDMLKAMLDDREPGLMKPRQQALAYALGYANGRYAPLYFNGVLPQFEDGTNPLNDIDRELLYSALIHVFQDSNGRTRSSAAYALNFFSKEDTARMAQPIYDAIKNVAMNYKMMDDGVRARGLDLFARLHIQEGLPLCFETFDLHRWGQVMRVPARFKTLQAYAGNAKPYLPQLHELRNKWKSGDMRDLLEKTIKVIEEDSNPPCMISLHDLVDARLEKDMKGKGTSSIRKLMSKNKDDFFYQAAGLRKITSELGTYAYEDLLSALSSESEVLSEAAAQLAADLTEVKTAQWSKHLASSNKNTLLGTLKVLTLRKDSQAIEQIKPLLEHEDEAVRLAAETTIEAIQ